MDADNKVAPAGVTVAPAGASAETQAEPPQPTKTAQEWAASEGLPQYVLAGVLHHMRKEWAVGEQLTATQWEDGRQAFLKEPIR